jgi:hypothetical protein
VYAALPRMQSFVVPHASVVGLWPRIEKGFRAFVAELLLRPDVVVVLPDGGVHLLDAKFRLRWVPRRPPHSQSYSITAVQVRSG